MYHKLPFYKCAADLLKLAKENGKNVKQVLYTEKKYRFMNIKALYALVIESLKLWEVVEILINDTNILVEESWLNVWHVRVSVTELIFGKKALDGDNKFGQTILRYEDKFKELLSTDRIQRLLTKSKPSVEFKVRYIKVNTLKDDVDSVINNFINEEWQQLVTADSYLEYLDQLKQLEQGSQVFLQDYHIPEVLAFPPGTELYSHDLYKNGSFYFMDKSSCLAPLLLRPHAHSTVLDMCAAPGLKTIHLAGLMQGGKVYAVERDEERFKSLKEMVALSGADTVVPVHKDVTRLEPSSFADVEYILLDPSCSGSGMRNRQPNFDFEAPSDDKSRLHKLAGFQISLLRFALTKFPAARRVVYSTCSVNVEENEEVVQAALNSKYHDFELASVKKKLTGWVNFGCESFDFGSKCIYSRPETDLTNGFFVAVFERRKHFAKDEPVKVSDEIEKNSIKKEIQKNRGYNENNDEDEKKCSFIEVNSSKADSNSFLNNKGWLDDEFQENVAPLKRPINKNKPFLKRTHDEGIDHETSNKYSSHKTLKWANTNCEEMKIEKTKNTEINDFHKLITNENKQQASKVLTQSQKKRMRERKRKISVLPTKNVSKKKIYQEVNNSSRKVKGKTTTLKKSKVVRKSAEKETSDVAEKLKISKAKLRKNRLKKLKLTKTKVSNTKADDLHIKTGIPTQILPQCEDESAVLKRKKRKYIATDQDDHNLFLHESPQQIEKCDVAELSLSEHFPLHEKKHKKLYTTELSLSNHSNNVVTSKNKLKKPKNKHIKDRNQILPNINSKEIFDENLVSAEFHNGEEGQDSKYHKKKHKKKEKRSPDAINNAEGNLGNESSENLTLDKVDSEIKRVKLCKNNIEQEKYVNSYTTELLSEEIKPHKKKHKKKLSNFPLSALNSASEEKTEENGELIHADNATSLKEVKLKKKKHKMKYYEDELAVNEHNSTNYEKKNIEYLSSTNNETERVKPVKKKHKKKHNENMIADEYNLTEENKIPKIKLNSLETIGDEIA